MVLTEQPDQHQSGLADGCIVALAGSDNIHCSAANCTVLAGIDADVIMAGEGALVRGGDGSDVINAYGGGRVLGNSGDDTISAGNGDSFVYAGPGKDDVACGNGDDTVVIYDLCEVTAGEKLNGGEGSDTLIAPVSLTELAALGVEVSNFENVVVQQNSCKSDCVTLDCPLNAECVDGSAPGQTKCECKPGFFGDHCEIDGLIDSVTLSDDEVCVNQPVTLSVQGVPVRAGATFSVTIGDSEVSERVLQFSGEPGTRRVAVSVASEGFVDSQIIDVQVVDCGDGVTPFVGIGTSVSPGEPNVIDFAITDGPAFGADARYTWDFGDGSSEEAGFRSTHHDYGNASDPFELVRSFVVSVSVEVGGSVVATGRRTLNISNDYAEDRARGVVRPFTQNNGGLALSQDSTAYSGSFDVDNIEQSDLVFTERWLEPIACAPGLTVPSTRREDIETNVPALSLGTIYFTVDADLLPSEVCSLGVRYVGMAGGLRVEASTYFELRPQPDAGTLNDAVIADALTYAIDHGLVTDPSDVTDTELLRLARSGRIPFSEDELDASASDNTVVSPLAKTAAAPDIGDLCTPGDTPPRPGVSCQLSRNSWGTLEFRRYSAHIVNAKKGDALLSQGCSPVAGLLTHVGQRYEHTGIMLEDRTEIRHAVLQPEYMLKYPKDRQTELCHYVRLAQNEAWEAHSMGGLCEALTEGQTVGDATDKVRSVCAEIASASAATVAEVTRLQRSLPDVPEAQRPLVLAQIAELQAALDYGCNFLPHPAKQSNVSYSMCVTVSHCDNPGEPTDGFDERAVKYGWPGPISQTVDQAFNGQWVWDTPDGDPLLVAAFHAHPSYCGRTDRELAFPRVLRPRIDRESATRDRLHRAAELARETDGHYRVFAFSRGDIALDLSHSPTVNELWPESVGTLPFMCSSFLWKAITDAGFELDRDRDNGPRTENTPAGMFLYSEAERRAAADFIYTELYDTVQGQAPNSAWLLDTPDDIANQFTNCFASDLCSPGDWSFSGSTGADLKAWTKPGIGITVSPDDLMRWDPATEGGPYGDSERLVYRTGGARAVTRWAVSVGTGTLSGRVRLNDTDQTPVAGARVSLAGLEVLTLADGTFDFGPLDAGAYELRVIAVIGGNYWDETRNVTVTADESTTLEVVLAPVPPPRRLVTVAGAVRVLDGEQTYDVSKRFLMAQALVVNDSNLFIVGPPLVDTSATASWRSECVDDETDMTLDIKSNWVVGPGVVPGTVRVVVTATLFEESECRSGEREDSDVRVVTLAPGTQEEVTLDVINYDSSFAPDKGSASLIIINGDYFEANEPTRQVRINGNMHILDYDRWSRNETGDLSFDQTRTLTPIQRAQSIPEQKKRVDGEVTGRFQTMAVLEANNQDVRLYTIEHQWDGYGCQATDLWIDRVTNGTSSAYARKVSSCNNYVETKFTVTNPYPLP